MASSHEQAAAAAAQAAADLARVSAEKLAVSVDRQIDRFAQTAERVKREGWNKTGGPNHGTS